MRDKSLRSIRDVDPASKSVLVRGDLDVDDGENPRIESVRAVVNQLLNLSVDQLKVIGHRETAFPICEQLRREYPNVEFDDRLREDPGEKANSEEFAARLAEGWDVYVNEAFATSHRKHASIGALPRLMRGRGKVVCVGERFEKEVEMLNELMIKVNSTRKSVLVIGGVKVEEKERFAETMKDKFGKVLKGGLLPGGKLRPDGLDISDEEVKRFVMEIERAEVILAAGVMGKYEDPNAERGTEEVLAAIANNNQAYKVVGGGDIEMAISKYALTSKFDWISVGGGAMLQYLSTGTLPGIEALVGRTELYIEEMNTLRELHHNSAILPVVD